jgi:hypothetical protein
MDHHFHLKAPSWVTCRQRRGCTTRPKRFVNGSILRSRAADRTSSTNETGKLCAGFHRSRLRTRQRTNRVGEGYSDPSHSCLILGPTNDWLWPHCWIRAYADITMAPRRPSVQPLVYHIRVASCERWQPSRAETHSIRIVKPWRSRFGPWRSRERPIEGRWRAAGPFR